MAEEISPVLMVDNELENISDLEDLIKTAALKAFPDYGRNFVDYAESAEEATAMMREMMKSGGSYSSIICDNHMDGILGEDFIRLIRGNLGYCFSRDRRYLNLNLANFKSLEQVRKCTDGKPKREISEFLDEQFGGSLGSYRDFTSYFQDERKTPLIILFCGNPNEADLTGLEDIYTISKPFSHPDSNDKFCEKRVMHVLEEEGIFEHDLIESAMKEHQRFSPETPLKKQAYNSSASRIKKKKKIFIEIKKHKRR